MSASAIIKEAISDGVNLALTERGTIKLSGERSALHRWTPIFKMHKPEIMVALQPATASRWWLINYPDGAPVEIRTNRPATQEEVLESRQDATVHPLHQDPLKAITTCSTCAHATYRGGCGHPVDAGLSDLTGVIRYSPDQGATCSAWQLHLDIDVADIQQANLPNDLGKIGR
jgi:hypothetical protein